MLEEIRIWQVDTTDGLTEIKRSKLDLEARIEKWISNDISLLASDLLVIGQQVQTGSSMAIDLLCIDRSGSIVIVELKRDKTAREVTAQALDYASWVKDLDANEIEGIAARYLKGQTLKDAFLSKFNIELPDVINEHHAMRIVASEIDGSTERIIHYLSETYDVDINAVRFQFFQTQEGRQFLVRTFTVAPQVVEQHVRRGGKRTRHTTREEFLGALDDNGKFVFGKILQFAESHKPEMPLHWGTVGFSLNVDLDGTHVAVFFCYPPTSANKQTIYTNRTGIMRTQVPEDEIKRLWGRVEATGLFQPAGRDLRCSIDRVFTNDEIGSILSLCDEMASAIVKYGIKD